MTRKLSVVYSELIRSWKPPVLPEWFESDTAINNYMTSFKDSYQLQLSSLEGKTVRSEEGIGVIKRASLGSICCEYAPLRESGKRASLSCSTGSKVLGGVDVLEQSELSLDDLAARELILKRLARPSDS